MEAILTFCAQNQRKFLPHDALDTSMAAMITEIRQGAYYDSVVLMQLQKSLVSLKGVLDAGVVMGTEANKQLLQSSDLLSTEASQARTEDLIIAVRAQDEVSARDALSQVDTLVRKRESAGGEDYRPRSLEGGISILPDSKWVLVSVPGRYAAKVARDALDMGRNVFLYSDNVSIEEEVSLKQVSHEKGLLVMGPDCGTAIINGAGLGFANRVRRGRIGIVAASGTGLQTVSVGIDHLGGGISHAIGTGSHDLSDSIRAITTLQGIELLRQDRDTDVIVLISKPPSPAVASNVLAAARETRKPVVIDFIGYSPSAGESDNLHFAHTLDEAAEMAVKSANVPLDPTPISSEFQQHLDDVKFSQGQKYLRGLYSGGTLAYEAQLLARDRGLSVYSNAPLDKAFTLPTPNASIEHSIVDLGSDEFMVGRLHPMIDNDLRIRRLRQEAEDASVAVILLDVVLGYGAHSDPASELAPAIHEAKARAASAGRNLIFVAVVIGTTQDPQNLGHQVNQLREAGALVAANHSEAVNYSCSLIEKINGPLPLPKSQDSPTPFINSSEVSPTTKNLDALSGQFGAVNIGLEVFYTSLRDQHMPVVQVDWRPPAGGNEKLAALLSRMKKGSVGQPRS